MNSKIAFITLFLSLSWGTIFASDSSHPVLVTDTNHDGAVSQKTIENGQDYFFVKQNPSKLAPGAAVFQTTTSGLYVAANFEDLIQPDAIKQLFLARETAEGPVKVATLANLGYAAIRVLQKPNGDKQVFLLTLKGGLDEVSQIKVTQPMFRLQDQMTKDNKPKAL